MKVVFQLLKQSKTIFIINSSSCSTLFSPELSIGTPPPTKLCTVVELIRTYEANSQEMMLWAFTMWWAFLRLGAATCWDGLNQDFGRNTLLWQSVNVSETHSHLPTQFRNAVIKPPYCDSAQKIQRMFS